MNTKKALYNAKSNEENKELYIVKIILFCFLLWIFQTCFSGFVECPVQKRTLSYVHFLNVFLMRLVLLVKLVLRPVNCNKIKKKKKHANHFQLKIVAKNSKLFKVDSVSFINWKDFLMSHTGNRAKSNRRKICKIAYGKKRCNI